MDLSTHSLTPGVSPGIAPRGPHGIRRLIRVSKRDAPSSCQRPTPMGLPPRLHLNAFQGEPAISGFAWHFTPTHRSSPPFAADVGSALHARVPRASACPWVAHPVSGRFRATPRPFGLAFAPAPRVARLASPPRSTRRLILQKARRHPNLCGHPRARPSRTTHVSLPLSGLRPARSTGFQDLFHSPRRGAFHRSLTVLVHYRSQAVFSLGWWSTPLPTGFRVSGGTHANAAHRRTSRRLRGSHPLRPPVPAVFG